MILCGVFYTIPSLDAFSQISDSSVSDEQSQFENKPVKRTFLRKIKNVKRIFFGKIESADSDKVIVEMFEGRKKPKSGSVFYAISKNNKSIIAKLVVKNFPDEKKIVFEVKEIAEGLENNDLIALRVSRHRLKNIRVIKYFGRVVKVVEDNLKVRKRRKSTEINVGDQLYVLKKKGRKVVAKLEVEKIDANMRFVETKLKDIKDELTPDLLKDLYVIKVPSKNSEIDSANEEYKSEVSTSPKIINKTLKLVFGASSFRFLTIDLVNDSDLVQESYSKNFNSELFLPVLEGIEWLNWFGLSFSQKNYNPSEIVFEGKESKTQQKQVLFGSENRLGLVFRPIIDSYNLAYFGLDYSLLHNRSENLSEEGGISEDTSLVDVSGGSFHLQLAFLFFDSLGVGLSYFDAANQEYVFTNETANNEIEGKWGRTEIGLIVNYSYPLLLLNGKLSLEVEISYHQRTDSIAPLSVEKESYNFSSARTEFFLGGALSSF